MKYLQSKSEIADGELTIKDTRILITDAITILAHGYTIDDLHDRWPHVSVTIIRGALKEAASLINIESNAKTLLQT
jgi:uncharacterized protein (DUF433 family)